MHIRQYVIVHATLVYEWFSLLVIKVRSRIASFFGDHALWNLDLWYSPQDEGFLELVHLAALPRNFFFMCIVKSIFWSLTAIEYAMDHALKKLFRKTGHSSYSGIMKNARFGYDVAVIGIGLMRFELIYYFS